MPLFWQIFFGVNLLLRKEFPNVICGLWVTMVCQYWIVRCNKCAAVVQDAGAGGGYMCVGQGGDWKHGVSRNFLKFQLSFAMNLKVP